MLVERDRRRNYKLHVKCIRKVESDPNYYLHVRCMKLYGALVGIRARDKETTKSLYSLI